MVDVSISGTAGVRIVAPSGAPTVHDGIAGVDVAVLEVSGGYLSWSVLAPHTIPAAVLDDLDAAQDWVWAVYGAETALALTTDATVAVEPARPALATAVHRLGYALWAARWWPASTLDAIPPLPPDLLAGEIAELAATCDTVVGDVMDTVVGDEHETVARASRGRLDDYALAAGDALAVGSAVVLGRGTAVNDWRTYPPHILDAAENAATWTLERRAGANVVRVAAVAAPDLDRELPEHLRPHAVVAGETSFALALAGDEWSGEVGVAAAGGVSVAVEVPGFGAGGPESRSDRERVREFVRRRLAAVDPAEWLLRAEVAAALADPDF